MEITSILPILTDGDTYLLVSPFGPRIDPITKKGMQDHKGVDIVLWRGWGALSAVGAAWDGVVTKVGNDASRGIYVLIDHGEGLVGHYYHLAEGSVTVAKGASVSAGERIGYMGSTGATTGAHLHFQLEYGGVAIDPLPYITGEDMIEVDVPDGEMDNIPADWAAEAVQWARENGILYGDDTGNLYLHEPVTCERMLVFLYRTYTKIKEDLGI